MAGSGSQKAAVKANYKARAKAGKTAASRRNPVRQVLNVTRNSDFSGVPF